MISFNTMLKNTAVALFLLFPFTLLFSQGLDIKEQNPAFWLYTESELCSKYIFRGIVLEDDYVFQPAVYAGYDGFGKAGTISTGVWFNFTMPQKRSLFNEEIGEYEFFRRPFTYNETDIYLMHELTYRKLTVKNTFAVYLFTSETGYPNTTEYIMNLSYPAGPLSLQNEFACDISAYPGAFVFTHGVGWEGAVTPALSLSTAVNLVWAGNRYNGVNAGEETTAINSFGFDASVTYSHNAGFYSRLRYQYNMIPDSRLRQTYGYDTWFISLLGGFTF